MMTSHTFTKCCEEAACDTVRRILEECGGMWAACYTQPEVEHIQLGDHISHANLLFPMVYDCPVSFLKSSVSRVL